MLEEHVNGLASTKTTLKSRVTDLEQELKKYLYCSFYINNNNKLQSHPKYSMRVYAVVSQI